MEKLPMPNDWAGHVERADQMIQAEEAWNRLTVEEQSRYLDGDIETKFALRRLACSEETRFDEKSVEYLKTFKEVETRVSEMRDGHTFEYPAETLLGKLERKVFENEIDSFKKMEIEKIKKIKKEEADLERKAIFDRERADKMVLIDKITTLGIKISDEIYVFDGQVYRYKEAWTDGRRLIPERRSPSGRNVQPARWEGDEKKRLPKDKDIIRALNEDEIFDLSPGILKRVYDAISRK